MAERQMPLSVVEVHRLVLRERPDRDAGPREWIKFHHRNAGMYAQVMRVDRKFEFEASVYSSGSLRIARELEHLHGLTYCRSTWS
jgi:hypothetical protein